jgi:hypothetical protein
MKNTLEILIADIEKGTNVMTKERLENLEIELKRSNI